MSTGPRIAITASPRKAGQKINPADLFQQASANLSLRFKDLLGSPIQIGEGTISAILVDSSTGFDFAVALAEAVWPMKLTISVISAGHQVGPAADANAHARGISAMLEARKNRKPFSFQMPGRKDAEMEVAEAAALLHATIREEWTATRALAVRTYRELGRQKDVAVKLNITQQAVSQMLRGARLKELDSLEAAMRSWLVEESRPGLWPLRNFEKDTIAPGL